jgi:hypothetical protein
MLIAVHPAETMLRGDGRGFNPRNISVTVLAGQRELLTGVFRDDGVGSTNRSDRPFQIVIPRGFQAWHSLNTRVFYALRSDSPEVIICLA